MQLGDYVNNQVSGLIYFSVWFCGYKGDNVCEVDTLEIAWSEDTKFILSWDFYNIGSPTNICWINEWMVIKDLTWEYQSVLFPHPKLHTLGIFVQAHFSLIQIL